MDINVGIFNHLLGYSANCLEIRELTILWSAYLLRRARHKWA